MLHTAPQICKLITVCFQGSSLDAWMIFVIANVDKVEEGGQAAILQ